MLGGLLLTAASNLAGATDNAATIVATNLIPGNAYLRFYTFEVLRGKAFPLVGTALPTHPLLRGDPATPP